MKNVVDPRCRNVKDFVMAAVNEALRKVDEMMESEMRKLELEE